MAGVIGSIAIATVRQIKNFGIFFLCGSSWKDCTRIITAYLTIFSFAIVLTLFSMAVMKIINMDYLMGSVYEMNSVPIRFMALSLLKVWTVYPFSASQYLSFLSLRAESPYIRQNRQVF